MKRWEFFFVYYQKIYLFVESLIFKITDMARRMNSLPFHEGRRASSKEVARKAVYEETGKYFFGRFEVDFRWCDIGRSHELGNG